MVHESRKKATAQNKIDMFLRRPKSAAVQNPKADSASKEPITNTKVLGSFKSTLERYQQHKTKE